MVRELRRHVGRALLTVPVVALAWGSVASANTITQNTSWTIDRSGTTTKYRVVGYGDSIYAGYRGSICRASPGAPRQWWTASTCRRSGAPTSRVIRRTKSGAKADDIYNNKIVAERSYMQAATTKRRDVRDVRQRLPAGAVELRRPERHVQLRRARHGAERLHELPAARDAGDQPVRAGDRVEGRVEHLLPGLRGGQRADQLQRSADRAEGEQAGQVPAVPRQEQLARVQLRQHVRLPVRRLLRAVHGRRLRLEHGRPDRLGRAALRPGRVGERLRRPHLATLRATIRDANTHFANASTSYDYIQSDNTHPTYSGATISVGLFGGTGTGSGAPEYTTQIVGGKNPIWNQFGHERMGWALSVFNNPTP